MGIGNEAMIALVAAGALMGTRMRAAHDGAPGPQWLGAWQAALRDLAAAARAAQADGLHAACAHLEANLAVLVTAPDRAQARETALLARWPGLVDGYLRGDDGGAAVEALMDFAIDPAWPCQIGLRDSAAMRGALQAFRERAGVAPMIVTTGPASLDTMEALEIAPEPAPRLDAPSMTAAALDLREIAPERVDWPAPSLETAFANLLSAVELVAGGDAPSVAALQACLDALQQALGCAAQLEALPWLDLLCRLQENLWSFGEAVQAGEPVALEPDLALALLDLPQLALALLAQPDDAALCDALLDNLACDAWFRPLPEGERDALRITFGFAPHARFDPIPNEDAPDSAFAPMSAPAPDLAQVRTDDAPERCDSEHLAVLAQEFAAVALAFDAEVEDARREREPGARAEAMERCGEMLQRIGETCRAVGLASLAEVFAQVALRVGACAGVGFDDAQCLWLRTLLRHVRAWLAAPDDPSACAALVEVLADGSWPPALPGPEAADLERRLGAVQFFTDTALRPQRATEAGEGDVSLEVPRDINPELLDGLLAELPLQSADFAAAMERLVSGQGSLFDLEQAKRAAHTLKGAANTVGVRGIAGLTHHLEDILIALTRHGRLPTRELTGVLVRAADCLEAMSEALQGVADAPADARPVLQQVLDWANRFDDLGAAALDGGDAAPGAPPAGAHDTTRATGDAAAEPDAAPRAPTEAAPQSMLRVPAALVDELLRLVGETMIANTQIKEQLRQTAEHVQAVTRQNQTLQQLTGDLETLVDIHGITAQASGAAAGPALDALEFERFNELHSVTRRLIEAATDARELSDGGQARLRSLSELLETQGRLHADNQQAVVGMRMVPVSGVVSRLQRSVRQTCRLLDKSVELEVRGEQTMVDVQILGELLDPLMHLLRNAVDHGIEPPAARAAAGKPAGGRIELAFAREGASVVVRCADDGAGLDLARIRVKAAERGLVNAGQVLSDDELARLVLLPGFSTRDESTEVSGRGIGMDAVHARVLALKGNLRLVNRPGQGLTVELRVPTSLMSAHGLLVRVNGQVLALTSFGIESIQHVSAAQLSKLGGQDVLMHGDRAVPVLPLARLLDQAERAEALERGWFPALLVRTDAGAWRAVRVHDTLDSQELVVKDLGRHVPHPPGVVGVTILGDGSITPVLDLPALLREASEGSAQIRPLRAAAAATSRIEARKSALVVDDSLSARRAAAQVMRDAGFDVRTAIDGLEAATLMEKAVPDVVVVDMEMPRMNGLELTTHIRTREATRHVPVIMVTSRSTDKHRQMAEQAGVNVYLTKPFVEDELERHAHRLTARPAARVA